VAVSPDDEGRRVLPAPSAVTEQDMPFGDQTVRCAAGPVRERRRDRRVAGRVLARARARERDA
jgi:hypothetical protein